MGIVKSKSWYCEADMKYFAKRILPKRYHKTIDTDRTCWEDKISTILRSIKTDAQADAMIARFKYLPDSVPSEASSRIVYNIRAYMQNYNGYLGEYWNDGEKWNRFFNGLKDCVFVKRWVDSWNLFLGPDNLEITKRNRRLSKAKQPNLANTVRTTKKVPNIVNKFNGANKVSFTYNGTRRTVYQPEVKLNRRNEPYIRAVEQGKGYRTYSIQNLSNVRVAN